ncbi:MAG: GAF domain-containing protein [Anaerolineae bacterium]|nr:GAF domain-containing protein [Anaerolineae bacterium]
MSKKQLYSRLKSLLTGLEEPPSSLLPTEQPAALLSGWTWECDENGVYLTCGQEIEDTLGIPASKFTGQSFFSFAVEKSEEQKLRKAFDGNAFPAEISVHFISSRGARIPVRITILAFTKSEEEKGRYHGFTQVMPRKIASFSTNEGLPENTAQSKHSPARTSRFGVTKPLNESALTVQKSVEPIEKYYKETKPWSKAAAQSLEEGKPVFQPASEKTPASIAIPFRFGDRDHGVLEILDENTPDRTWTEAERLLVQEVANQVALALENASLYTAVQQELSERIRAEQEILKRNQDLATLNRIGQQLSTLTSPDEIFRVLKDTIGAIVECQNLTVAILKPKERSVAYPIHIQDGVEIALDPTPINNHLAEWVMRSRIPLILSHDVKKQLTTAGITLPERIPLSLIAIPMFTGERDVGAIIIEDYSRENAFTSIQTDLLSTMASQVTTALENANLFQEIRTALETLENRERYQANVARSVAILSQSGTRALPEVFEALSRAAQNSRIYFAQVEEDENGPYWKSTAEWVEDRLIGRVDWNKLQHIPLARYPRWTAELSEKGWVVAYAEDAPEEEQEFLREQQIGSTLLLAVPGKSAIPGFIALDQIGQSRRWLTEEINVLRVAADAIGNTIVREDLLKQLQGSLDETENLYNASHRLALASDLQEMVAAITYGVRSGEINRGVLVLFEYDAYDKLSRLEVSANWYSGRGTPPPPVGQEFGLKTYEKILIGTTPVFYDDLRESALEEDLQKALTRQHIRSLAALPLWAGKRQLGTLLLLSEERHHFTPREMRSFPPLIDQMAIAVENMRLFQQTQKALSETGQLYKISSGIAQAADTQDLLNVVAREIMPKKADNACLMILSQNIEGEFTDLEVIATHGKPQILWRPGQKIPAASLPLVRTLTNEVVVFSNISQSNLDPSSKKTLQEMNIEATCIVPLRASGRLTGILNVSADKPSEFETDELRLLQVAGNGIAVAIERQRLLHEAQRRAIELQAAAEIARDTTSTLSLDILLKRIIDLLIERFQFYYAAIFLMDEQNRYAIVQEASGQAGKEMKEQRYRLPVGSKSIIGSVTVTGIPMIVADVSQSPIFLPHPKLEKTRSEMGIPLKLGNRIIGALDIQSDQVNAFTQDIVAVLQILADQIAVAIDNARSYELAQRAVEEMKEVDRLKSQFLANMSHELRTPLNSIIGFSRVILKGIDGPVNELQQQDLTAIYNSGQHLLVLINDILDLSKIEAGKMELAFTEIHVSDLINSVMSTAIGLVKDKPIEMNYIISPDLPTVQADATRVRQVLLNFISNAAKFTEQGTITVEAKTAVSPEGKPEVMITVTDTGSGIAPEDEAKLFQPFSQVDDSPTRKTGGTGLGLSISRSLIELHHGRIGLLYSEVGKGSTFFFTLPATESIPIEQTEEHLSRDGLRILSIDDDLQVIGLYTRYLKPHGYQVIPLTDPKLAVERAKTIRPFAITLDIMMPEKDGWEVIHDLKRDPETQDIPIIICSILEEEEKGFSLGAADYLVKPFLQEDLTNAIHRVNPNGSIHHILIIDDNPDDLRLVQKMLENSNNYQLTLAESGEKGWEVIQNQKPDAIILDLFMPGLNGFTILGQIRSDPQLADIPVIILTGADLSADQHQQLVGIGQELLTKGLLRENELLITLEKALKKIRLP